MLRQLDWASGKSDEHVALDWQVGAGAFAGQWREARELSRRAIDLATRGNTKEVAARYATERRCGAPYSATAGKPEPARRKP